MRNFNPRTPILYFDLRAPTKPARSVYVCWPAWVHRVIAPQPQMRRFNLFQKAVLGFCRIGETDPMRIATFLHLDPQMVGYLFRELFQQGYIEASGNPHPRVQAELDEEVYGEQSLVTGVVFSDPWSGQIWPRFTQFLNYAEVEKYSNGLPELNLGSKGKPFLVHPYLPDVEEDSPPDIPKPTDVLFAVHSHYRAQFFLNQHRGHDFAENLEELRDFDWLTAPPRINRVSIIEDDPLPVWLLTALYVPEAEIHRPEWYVYDPFGLGANSWLHRSVEMFSTRDRNLHVLIDNLLTSTGVFSESNQGIRKELENWAHKEARNKLVPSAFQNQFLLESILSMQESLLEVEAESSLSADKLDDVAIRAGKVIERLFRQFWSSAHTNDILAALPQQNAQYRDEWLNSLAESFGYVVPLPRAFLKISPLSLKTCLQTGEGTLTQKIQIALLSARIEEQHPLRYVADEMPDLFAQLAQVIQMRNTSAHDSPNRMSLREQHEKIKILVSSVYAVVNLLS